MARLRGRVKDALDETRQQAETARTIVAQYKAKLQEAEAVLMAYEGVYERLQRTLTTPRQPSKPTVGTTATTKRVYERCTRCDKTKGHRFHKDSTDADYHSFVSPVEPDRSPPKEAYTLTAGNGSDDDAGAVAGG